MDKRFETLHLMSWRHWQWRLLKLCPKFSIPKSKFRWIGAY